MPRRRALRQALDRSRPAIFPALAVLAALAAAAVAAQTGGRWEGVAKVPGAPLPLVLDIDAGAGSVTLPGRSVSGAPLRDLVATPATLRASLAAAIPAFGASGPAPSIELERQADGSLAGTFRQAGLAAPLALRRTGEAQVQAAPASTPIAAALAGTWRGRYELFGYPREVTLKLRGGPAAPAQAELVIVGRRTTNVPIDRVAQGPAFITLESGEFGMTIEGRWSAGTIDGTLQQGPIEVPLVLTRDGGAS